MHDKVSDAFDELLSFDDSLVVLDRDDRSKLKDAKRQSSSTRATTRNFMSGYSTLKAKVHPVDPVPPPIGEPAVKGRGRGGARGKGRAGAPPALAPVHRPLPPGALPQSELRDHCPVGGHIWRGYGPKPSWDCHYPPFRRRTFPFSLWGERGAAIACLRHLWDSALFAQDRARSTCPVPNLFVGDGASALPSH